MLAVLGAAILVAAGIIIAIVVLRSDHVGQEKTSLRLKWIAYIGWAGEYAALDRGLWKDQGLDVDVRPGGFEQDPIRLVPSGSDQFGVVGGDTLLQAREKGLPVVAIALQYQTSPAGFMAKASSGIKTPKDFQGRKVGISPGTDKHSVYLAMLSAARVDRSKIVEVPVKVDLTPFFMDQVEVFPVFITNQPITARDKGFEVNVIDPKDYGVSYIGNVYFTTEEMILKHPERVRRFLAGVIQGWEWALSAPEEQVVTMILKYNKELDRKNQRRVLSAVKPYIKPPNGRVGWMTREQWVSTSKILREQGALQSEVDVDKAFTMKFLEDVYGR
jgi:ABC-type nitrate/sulfonate/bicarbonate transport system substrate-binding protein